MNNVSKYTRQFFEAPKTSMKWTERSYIDKAPQWCSVDLRDGNQALIIPMSLGEKYSVAKTYGRENFPGLSLAAKSGTAEVGGGKEPNAWFVGFSTDEAFPVAFVVMIENGGSGTYSAGRVANAVLQEAKKLF